MFFIFGWYVCTDKTLTLCGECFIHVFYKSNLHGVVITLIN